MGEFSPVQENNAKKIENNQLFYIFSLFTNKGNC